MARSLMANTTKSFPNRAATTAVTRSSSKVGLFAAASVIAAGSSLCMSTAAPVLAREKTSNLKPTCDYDWQSNPNVIELHSAAIHRLMTLIRDKDTSPAQYAYYADRLMRYVSMICSLFSFFLACLFLSSLALYRHFSLVQLAHTHHFFYFHSLLPFLFS